MTEFATGTLVRLKSGSPILTVDETRGDGVVVVMYWSGSEFIRETFLPEMLILNRDADEDGAQLFVKTFKPGDDIRVEDLKPLFRMSDFEVSNG